VTTGPQDPAAAGRDRLRACHADREQVLETLKDAFVHGRLTKDELDTRAGRALAARTYADLAPLTADIPPAVPAGAARPPAAARRRPLARAVAGSGICLVIAAAAVRAAFIFDPGPSGPTPHHSLAPLMLFLALMAVLAALGFVGYGVVTSVEHRRSRRRLPPRPGPGGHAGDGERRGRTGDGPVPPGPRTGQTRTDLRAHTSRQRRRHVPARAGRALRGVRLTPDAA
jgi:Domain of unknown function (DUF1707)